MTKYEEFSCGCIQIAGSCPRLMARNCCNTHEKGYLSKGFNKDNPIVRTFGKWGPEND